MARTITTAALQSPSAKVISEHYTTYVTPAVLAAAAAATAAAGVSNAGVSTTVPPVATANAGIEPLDLAPVRPGDLITAAFINELVDAVVAIDTRLQKIETLLAKVLDQSVPGKP